MNSTEAKLERLQNITEVELTATQYNLVIGAVLMWGLFINYLMALYLTYYIIQINYLAVLAVYLITSLGCVHVIYKSNIPLVSFLGFTGLSAAMGLLLTYYLTLFDQSLIYDAFLLTTIVVGLVLIAAAFFPAFFLSLGRTLFLTLLIGLIVELIAGIVLRLNVSAMDYVVVLVFSGYIGYDWSKAQQFPRNLDNAIDSAADIYVDIVNIFMRILSILSRVRDK